MQSLPSKTPEQLKRKVNLVFGIHCHQPAGNFDFVFEEVYQRSYLPFIEVVSRHPGVKMTLHYTGGLLEWIEDHHPEWFDLVRPLVEAGQVELLGGGYFEPILASIPEEDRRSQIQLLSNYLLDKFGQSPRGMWLAERIWESSIVPSLVKSKIEYVLVDDSHFISTGLDPENLYGYYLTEEEGYPLAIFPIDAKLRYLTPFQPVEKSLEYLAEIADESGERCVVVVDDGEKYGSWPDTYNWVYTEGWLDQFLTALQANQDWLKTMTFSQVKDTRPGLGRIYLPTASYFEMNQWCLPAVKAGLLGRVERELEDLDKLETVRPFLHGGIWKNFLVKYPESNQMHKKMLYLSSRIKQLPESEERDAAQKLIYKAQTNDAYWHGVFGGLYLPHLRHAIYRYLIKAERCLDAARQREERKLGVNPAGAARLEFLDLNMDSRKEVLISTPFYTGGLTPSEGGQLFEFSVKSLGYNLLNTLQRRFEHYHDQDAEPVTSPVEEEGVATIHARETEVDQQLRKELAYDWYARRMFIDHFLGEQISLDEFADCQYAEQGDFVNQAYEWLVPDQGSTLNHAEKAIGTISLRRRGGAWDGESWILLELTKTFTFADRDLIVNYGLKNCSQQAASFRFGVECNLSMPSCGGPGGHYQLEGQGNWNGPLDLRKEDAGISQLKLVDEVLKGTVEINWDRPAALWRFPVETVSQSESGWEKTYQSSVVMPIWHLELNPGEKWRVGINLRVDW